MAAATEDRTLIGTPQYMSPEQLERRTVDARSDVFACGAVLYEMVTGQAAFAGSSQASVIAAILEREPAPIAQRVSDAPDGARMDDFKVPGEGPGRPLAECCRSQTPSRLDR